MDILIKNMEMPTKVNHPLFIRISSDGHIAKGDFLKDGFIETEAKAVALQEHGRLISAEDFIDSFEGIINECRRQLSEKGEDIRVLNYFHDTIVELMGYMPTVLEASNGTDNQR